MSKDYPVPLSQSGTFTDALTEGLRSGARTALPASRGGKPCGVRIEEHFDKLFRDGRRPQVPTWTSSTAMA
jgi:hypothetical protein